MKLHRALIVLLTLFLSIAHAEQYVAGDVAPKGAPDGQLNAADLVVLERFILGDLIPDSLEQIIGDVAPIGAPDSTLNAADLLILQRAIFGDVILAPITIGPPAPTLDSVTSPTSFNPYQITGSATANTTVYIYVEGNRQHEITSAADGTFAVGVYLFDGNNNIYATEYDGVDESAPSNTVQVNYINTISRIQGDTTTDGPISVDTVWTPGLMPTPYNITSNFTVNADVTFVIQPGTVLLFDDGTRLSVNGKLFVSNAGDQVVFSSSNTSLVPGSWTGLVINGSANDVVIDNALIEWASFGVWVNSGVDNTSITNSAIKNITRGVQVDNGATNVVIDNVLIENAFRGVELKPGSINTSILNSTIRNISQQGISFNSASGTVSNNVIDLTNHAISLRSASPLITNNVLSDSSNGIWMLAQSAVISADIKGNTISGNNVGINIAAGFQGAAPVIDSGNIIINNGIGLNFDNENGVGPINPIINNNEIYSNNIYNIYAGRDSNTIDATGNWWGTVVISDIAASIYDFTDQVDQRSIDYSGFLGAPNGNPVPGNYLPQVITGYTPLTSGIPYQALGNVRVESGATLSISAGVVLQFSSSMELLIEGTLDVNGTPQNPVIFTSSSLVPSAGDWSGIILDEFSTNNIIDGAIVEYAITGIDVKATSNNTLITNSVIRINNTYGINFNLAGGTVSNNVISEHSIDSVASGIYVHNASPLIDNNVIYNNKIGIYITHNNDVAIETSPQITNNTISNNSDGINESTSTAQISGNIISNNTGHGIRLFNSASVINLGNIITNNNIGIYLRAGSAVLIDGNTIVDNIFGIYFQGSNSDAVSQPIVTNNDIYGNTWNLYFYQVPGAVALNISNNWWGTDNAVAIRATIGGQQSNLVVLVPLDTVANVANENVLLPRNITISEQYISPSITPNVQDTNDLTADISQSANWTVEVRDNTNQTVSTYTGTGTAISVSWDGKNVSAQYMPDGQYLFVISINGAELGFSPFTVDNMPPQADFDAALNNAMVTSTPLLVLGNALDINFTNYTLEVANGFTPQEVDYRQIANVTTAVVNNTLLNWPIGDTNNALAETQGQKTLRLTVNDNAGNTTVSTIPITLNHPFLSNVSHDTYTITPTLGEQVTVSFDLGSPATVYLRFYPERDATQNNMVAEVFNVFASTGTQTISWDGMSTVSANPYLVDEAYRFELVAVNASSEVIHNRTELLDRAGICSIDGSVFNAGQNKHVNFTCTPLQPARIVFDGAIARAVDTGVHTLSWNLRNISDKIIDTQIQFFIPGLISMRKDSVIIKGNTPIIVGENASPNIEVIATPHTVTHSFEQISEIVYQVDQDSDVSIRLLKPCYSSNVTCTIDHDDPTAIALFDGTLQAKDGGNQPINHRFEWRGYDFNAAIIDSNNILVDEEGYFTFSIKATSTTSGLSTIYRGAINLAN